MDWLSGWFGQVVALAAGVAALAAIFQMGYKVGGRDIKRARDEEVSQRESQLAIVRKDANSWRDNALMWKGRYEESSTGTGNVAQQKLNEIRRVAADSKSLWFRPVTERFSPRLVADGGAPIITIGNLKGGVGKTTLATHLAAYFAETRRVLFVDLDYQGTGSSLLLRAAQMADQSQNSKAQMLLRPFTDYALLQNTASPLGAYAPNLSVIAAHYALADEEEALMLRWVIGDETSDIRYNLSKALQSNAFKFELVIIDAPPRLTTAMAQALAASTHVLIPTQLERKATEAALYFSGILRSFAHQAINPHLQMLGIVPNMVQSQTGYSPSERAEIAYLNEALAGVLPGHGHVWESNPLYDKIAFARPSLVFHGNDQGAREAAATLRRLGKEIARRVGIEQ